jgi:hypothetical protein
MRNKLGFRAVSRFGITLACALAFLPPALAATVTVPGGGSAVTLATLNTGDTINITVTLTTTDAGENAEKPAEPLIISSIENGQQSVVFTAGNYALSTSFPQLTAKMNNTVITASISGADNDETGTVNFVVNNNPVNSLTGDLKGAYNQSALAIGIFAGAMGAAAALTAAPCPPCAAALGIGTGITGLMAAGLAILGSDPADPNFMVIATSNPPVVNVSGLSQPSQTLINTLTQVIGLENALFITRNRLSGAVAAGDQFWQQKQAAAQATYEGQIAPLFASLAAQFHQFAADLNAAGGSPFTNLTAAMVSQFEADIAANGLPSSISKPLQSILMQLGPTALSDQNTITQALFVQDPQVVANVANTLLTDTTLNTALATLATGFGATPVAVSAILPGSRSAALNTTPTVFATILNTSPNNLSNCLLTIPSTSPTGLDLTGLTLNFATTNPATNAVNGKSNQPAAIAAHGSQTFVIAFKSSTALSLDAQPLNFVCDGGVAAPITDGVNTIDLLFSSGPVADVIALSATASNDGVVRVPFSQNSPGAFALASINVGAADNLTVTTDTGGVTLPISVTLCQSNPSTGQCLTPPAASVAVSFAANATPTFSIFVAASNTVPFSPGTSRVFARFLDSKGVSHGSTSVAVATD